MKGIKCESGMLISNGTITIDSADDSIHSNTSITVNGGTFEIASGDDAFHADDTLTVTGGTVNITESYEGLKPCTWMCRGEISRLSPAMTG